MTAETTTNRETVDITLDLRQLRVKLEGRDDFFDLWKVLAPQFVGKQVLSGEWNAMVAPDGEWRFLVLDSGGLKAIGPNTRLNVIDLVRPPEIRHACREHLSAGQTVFGAFFCPVCRQEGQPDRLCESHAQFLENKFTAYCRSHVPTCQCHSDCVDPSTFECDRCRRPFAENRKRRHPNDPLTLLCDLCFAFQFETCADCAREGRRRLGKSRCAFPTSSGDERHGKRLCTLRHARQWQVWGPHWRGIALCDEHYRGLAHARPTELLWMLVAARAPAAFLRERIKDVYRLRNIVSYVRRSDFSWPDMLLAMRELTERASQTDANKVIRETVTYIAERITREQMRSPVIESQLLARVREFYRGHLRSDPAAAILSVTIKRVFGREGDNQTYRIAIRAGKDNYGRSMKGILIGKGGVLVNQLKSALGLQGIDFEE